MEYTGGETWDFVRSNITIVQDVYQREAKMAVTELSDENSTLCSSIDQFLHLSFQPDETLFVENDI
jgi:hypothetical protein